MWTFISLRIKPQLSTRPTEYVIDFSNIWATRVFRWWIYLFSFPIWLMSWKKKENTWRYRMCYGKGNIKYFRNNNSRLNCIQACNQLSVEVVISIGIKIWRHYPRVNCLIYLVHSLVHPLITKFKSFECNQNLINYQIQS
jgi:hypothetical protein